METKEIIEKNDYSIFEDLDCTEIDMYYSGWECDSVAWIFNDGRIFGTDHGSVCEISRTQFEVYKNELKLYIQNVEYILGEANSYKDYEITFRSKDNQVFTYRTSQLNEIDAVEKCTTELIEKGWLDQFQYKFDNARIITTKGK